MTVLIADSGSTKTDWTLFDRNGYRQSVKTAGFNPFFQSEEEMTKRFRRELKSFTASPDSLFFYGAGCLPGEPADRMKNALLSRFPTARIEVESDLTGAARAVCGHEAGIAGILGTGSNSCFYDGRTIVRHVPPLGFILGDEGSGAHLGKNLVADLLKDQLPEKLKACFLERFELTQNEIIQRVYSRPYPNRFLASLSVFFHEHREEPALRQLLRRCFKQFFERNIYQYDYRNHPVHLCGSIGSYYEAELREVASEQSIRIGKIVQAPTEGLIDYHLNELNK